MSSKVVDLNFFIGFAGLAHVGTTMEIWTSAKTEWFDVTSDSPHFLEQSIPPRQARSAMRAVKSNSRLDVD